VRITVMASAIVMTFAAFVQAEDPPGDPAIAPQPHPIELRNPPSLGTLDTGLRDASGAVVGVACATCHDPDDEGALARKGEVPEDFHAGIDLMHGDLRCQSCHDPADRTRLRLADGATLPFDDVVNLCGQCHGPQRTAFWKGAHGGGRGYWDRTRGPWIRNSCVACHRAHAPAYPKVMPAAPPNDRFLPIEGVVEAPDHE